MIVRHMVVFGVMLLSAVSARTGWSAEPASRESKQTGISDWVSSAEAAARKAAHEASVAAKEAKKALKEAGVEAADAAARAARAASTGAAEAADRAEEAAAKAAAQVKEAPGDWEARPRQIGIPKAFQIHWRRSSHIFTPWVNVK